MAILMVFRISSVNLSLIDVMSWYLTPWSIQCFCILGTGVWLCSAIYIEVKHRLDPQWKPRSLLLTKRHWNVDLSIESYRRLVWVATLLAGSTIFWLHRLAP